MPTRLPRRRDKGRDAQRNLSKITRPEVGGEQAQSALAPQIDLPEAIAGRVETLDKEQVVAGRSLEMGDAPAVDGDLGRGVESSDSNSFGGRLCSHERLSRMMTGDERAVRPRRQQRALAGAYRGHQRTAGMERTARRNVGWTRQFTAQ